MFSLIGKITTTKDSMKLIYDDEIIRYYKWLIENHLKIVTHSPLYDAHTSIILPKFHCNKSPELFEKWKDATIEVEYKPYIYCGTVNFYLRVQSNVLDYICEDFDISSDQLHLTICNIKNGKQPYFKKWITIQ